MSSGDSPNLILTGFMGTGKSSVARIIAQRTRRSLVDMDTEIEKRARKPVPKIFAEDGEEVFRAMEAAMCRELSEQRGLVISTGGGALIDDTNRDLMLNNGTVILLRCDVDEILHRVQSGSQGDRPLLDVDDPPTAVEQLLRQRKSAYDAIPWHIDTTGKAIEDVAEQAMQVAEAISLPVEYPGGQYPIHVGAGLLVQAAGAFPAAGVPDGGRVAIVSNPIVAPLYADKLMSALEQAGYRPFVCQIQAGEESKTLDTVSTLYGQFLEGNLDRSGTVLSLGGGVTGDIAGFAAASFMRGVAFIQVPTTLLAMVDASIGGKSGVDLPQGKNLVGAFKQPALVLIDPDVLKTLSESEMRSGLAEVIKHGVIADQALFEILESGERELSYWWGDHAASQIVRALRVKQSIVEEDPFERGRRAVLNLGHTIGHALEKMSDYSLRHGEAVSIGMVGAADIAHALGRCEGDLARRIRNTLSRWGLPIASPPYSVESILRAMSRDKKRQGHGLRWILPRDIGDVDIVEDVPLDVVRTTLCNLGARSD
jgi:shikimate kinase/3-dehydroquinate synthase